MNKVRYTTKQFLLLSFMALVVFSCSKDNEGSVEQEKELSTVDVKTVLETDQVSGAADEIVRELFNGTQSAQTAKNNDCYQATYSNTGFSVSFDDCSVEENGEKLKGSLSVEYGSEGDSFAYTVMYDNLMVGEIALDGTRSFTLSGEENNSVLIQVTSDMTITMADGEKISEKGNKTLAFVFNEDFSDGVVTLDGDWILKADGNTYSVGISKLLETGFNCSYVGKGLMLLNKNGLEVTVDFGDGSCDAVAELVYPNGSKENISL